MHILIHEFGGYSFPLQLSRELAGRGHVVTHVYPTGLPGPKGRVERARTDPEELDICPIPLSSGFRKYSPLRRLSTQRKYAYDLKRLIDKKKPDAVLSADTPIDVQAELLWYCKRKNIRFTHWVQDVYCHAIEFYLSKKVNRAAGPLSYPFRRLEIAVAKQSDEVIVISPAFRDLYLDWGIPKSKIEVIENWAPLDELPTRPRHNYWSKQNDLDSHTVFLYCGTLGLKHRPDLLYSLAKELGSEHRVVVISEGVGREYLERMPRLENLILLDFQPYVKLPEVLATADVLVAMLESEASRFAVPSKILSYLCCQRPLLMATPKDNLSASVIERSGGGIVVNPNNATAWIEAANALALDEKHRLLLGSNARKYAEQAFDVKRISDAFEDLMLKRRKSEMVPALPRAAAV
jgi:colanic acid biosynthesis glycosyl transferase WcaI